MNSPLRDNIARAVLREWLSSKSGVLDGILLQLADQLKDIAQKECAAMLLASFDPDPRQAMLDEAHAMLEQACCTLAIICEGINGNAITNEAKQGLGRLTWAIDTYLHGDGLTGAAKQDAAAMVVAGKAAKGGDS